MAHPRIRPSKEELEVLYLHEKRTNREIASRYGVCKSTVSKWKTRYGIVSRPPGRRQLELVEKQLREAVAQSVSVAEVVRRLGFTESGSAHKRVKFWIKDLRLDTAHFLGQRAYRGCRYRGGPRPKKWREVLVKRMSGRRRSTNQLRRCLIEYGKPHRCKCGLQDTWEGGSLVLEVHHRNGDWLDDRPENLEFLCPNCHKQTLNHHRKKRTRKGVDTASW